MDPRTIFELFEAVTSAHPDEVAFRYKKEGAWRDVTWSDQRRAVDSISKSLIALGVEKGDAVGVVGSTRLEWVQCDSAIVNIGAVTVGIYHSLLAADCSYVIQHSETALLFVEDEVQLKKILAVRDEMPALRRIVLLDGPGDESLGVIAWSDFIALGSSVAESDLERRNRSIAPDDLASLVYTSGTTGLPKGAMISHANLLCTARAADAFLPLEPGYTTLLFLPLAHVFARLIVYLCMQAAVTIAFAEDLGKIAENLREVRPHFIGSVPRIYEKFHEKIVDSATRGGGFRACLFNWAVRTGSRVEWSRMQGKRASVVSRLQHAVADRLVLAKVREAFGGRIIFCASGAAPLNPKICEFFVSCGVPLIEGFGLTENTGLSNANRIDRIRAGTVGPVVSGVEMKLAPDGEVLFSGGNVMAGYFKDPQATAKAIDEDGWLRSGDIGTIDEDGYLEITDRKKDLIVTAGGKNVAPQRIEKFLRESRFISQAVAYGDRRKFISALITLDADNVRRWAAERGLELGGRVDLAGHPAVLELIEREIAERNRELASFESVKKFRILPRDLSIETGELTPTLKPKRKVIYGKYGDLLDEMYGD